MARPRKSLLERVEDASFLARQHHELLSDAPRLRWKSLARLQDRYQAAAGVFEQRQVAREFEKAVTDLRGRRQRAQKPLAEHMEKLGPPGSGEQLKAFFPAYLRWPDGGRFQLDPYQLLTIDLGWRRDRHGRRIFKEIGEGIPRGCGKTPFWSGIGMHQTLAGVGRPKVFQTSGGKEQAKLGLDYVADWIDEDKRLQAWLSAPSSRRVARRDGRGEYVIVPASGSLGHGKKPNIGLVDEYWTIETVVQEKTVTALETAIHKVDDAFWAWISTAGYDKDTELGQAYESALKLPNLELHDDGFNIRAWDEESGRLFLWWGLPDGYELDLENDEAMLAVIRKCNPATWINHYELLRAMKRVRDREDKLNEWIRFNLNGWTKAKGAWLPAGAWAQLRSAAKFDLQKVWAHDPEIPAGSEIWVAVDAAKKRDTTACAWAARLPDGRIALRVRVWSARDGVPHHVLVPGGRIRNSLVEDFIVNELGSRYSIREVVYDPRFFDTQGENLSDAGFTVAEFPQNSALMADAWQHFYEATLEKTITVPPDRVFASQVAAAAAVLTESGWKVFKLKSSEPIDAVSAGAMARERCARAPLRSQPWSASW